jgi:hypothetical protein
MEFKSSHFNLCMNEQCKDILTDSMKEMIIELSSNAIFVMNTDMEAGITVRTAELIVEILKNSKFRFMPFHLVIEGFHKGSMGELGGTTRFTVRNVNTWMNAMYDKLAQINMEKKTKEDAERRAAESAAFKSRQKTANLYGAAMYRKIEWAHAGLLSSAEYDRLTLDKIVARMQEGFSIKELTPSMIL